MKAKVEIVVEISYFNPEIFILKYLILSVFG